MTDVPSCRMMWYRRAQIVPAAPPASLNTIARRLLDAASIMFDASHLVGRSLLPEDWLGSLEPQRFFSWRLLTALRQTTSDPQWHAAVWDPPALSPNDPPLPLAPLVALVCRLKHILLWSGAVPHLRFVVAPGATQESTSLIGSRVQTSATLPPSSRSQLPAGNTLNGPMSPSQQNGARLLRPSTLQSPAV